MTFYGSYGLGVSTDYEEYSYFFVEALSKAFTNRDLDLQLLVCEGPYCGAVGYLEADFTGKFLGKFSRKWSDCKFWTWFHRICWFDSIAFKDLTEKVQFHYFRHLKLTNPLCIKCTNIGSLLWLTSQSFAINKIRTHTKKVYFAGSFNWLSCQFAEKWATQFWAFFPFLRNFCFSPINL